MVSAWSSSVVVGVGFVDREEDEIGGGADIADRNIRRRLAAAALGEIGVGDKRPDIAVELCVARLVRDPAEIGEQQRAVAVGAARRAERQAADLRVARAAGIGGEGD